MMAEKDDEFKWTGGPFSEFCKRVQSGLSDEPFRFPDKETVATLARHGHRIEREETIVASEKPWAVKDQTPLERLFLAEAINEGQFDAGVKIQWLWRKVGPISAKAANWNRAGGNGDLTEEECQKIIQARRDLDDAWDVCTDLEVQATIAVVVFEESPYSWAGNAKVRRERGPQYVVDALTKIAEKWKM